MSTMYTDIEMNINSNMKMNLNEIDFSNPIPIFKEIEFEKESKFIPFGLEGAKRTNLFKNIKCEKMEIIPHAHGTHLESKSHLSNEKENETIPFSLNGPLITKIVDIKMIKDLEHENEKVRFLIIKKESPRQIEFEGVNDELIEKVFRKFPRVEVIGINEPSFDPEFDSGKLLAHRKAFFRSRTKSIYLVESLNLNHVYDGDGEKGNYYCFLNLYRFGSSSDAYPCSLVLYPISHSPRTEISDKMMILNESGCLFCKIIRGTIPAFKVYENNLTLAFLDINPLSEGHILVIPKYHGERLHDITDEHLADILPVCRKILLEGFGENGAKTIPAYNILENNGRLAHQEVEHVHFHIIPKRNEEEGLGIKWPAQQGNMETLKQLADKIRSNISE